MFHENLKTMRKAKGYTQVRQTVNGKKVFLYLMQMFFVKLRMFWIWM